KKGDVSTRGVVPIDAFRAGSGSFVSDGRAELVARRPFGHRHDPLEEPAMPAPLFVTRCCRECESDASMPVATGLSALPGSGHCPAEDAAKPTPEEGRLRRADWRTDRTHTQGSDGDSCQFGGTPEDASSLSCPAGREVQKESVDSSQSPTLLMAPAALTTEVAFETESLRLFLAQAGEENSPGWDVGPKMRTTRGELVCRKVRSRRLVACREIRATATWANCWCWCLAPGLSMHRPCVSASSHRSRVVVHTHTSVHLFARLICRLSSVCMPVSWSPGLAPNSTCLSIYLPLSASTARPESL
ncbi:unnamed protein product, partial [Protopolystoma xenopodis]